MSDLRPATAEILIVEADSKQLHRAALALRDCAVSSSLHIARDAAEASRRLRGEGGEEPVQPSLVILGDGSLTEDYVRFLFELRSGEVPERRAPVIALLPETTDRRTLQTCRDLANCCLRRPETQEEWLALMQAAETLWLGRRIETEPLPRRRASDAVRALRRTLRRSAEEKAESLLPDPRRSRTR